MSSAADRDRLAVLVHEVRSPVAALEAIRVALGAESLGDGHLRELVSLALAASRSIDRIVTDAALASVVSEPVDLADLVRGVASAAKLRGGVNVRCRIETDAVVAADPLRLRQALDNLVANAIAVSPPSAVVVVGLGLGDGEARISVTDAGPGIPPEEHERIFERGVRLHPQRPGEGIGLAVARAVADSHGGRLSVVSTPGAGATFTLALPLSGEAQPAT